MKTFILTGIALTAFAGMAGTEQTLTSVCDLGTFTPTTTKWLYFKANTTNDSFTLSQDADFSSLDFCCNAGDTSFDFARDGNHTIKVKTFRAANANAKWVILKGGIWDLGTGSGHDFRFWYNDIAVDGRTMVLDSCVVTNVDYLYGIRAANSKLVLQNASTLYAKTISYLNSPGAIETSGRTHNRVEIKNGSQLLWGNTAFNFDANGSTDALADMTMEVTGASVVRGNGSGSSSFTLGATSSGNMVHIGEGSLLYVPRVLTIGNAANAKYNVLKVDGGSAVTNGNDLLIGNVDGAEYNRLELIDSELYGGEYNGVYVGYKGSFNELIVSNSAIKRCYFCCAGYTASSSNNTVKIIGVDSSIGGSKYDMRLFGRGPNNMYILDGCSIGSPSKACYFAYESSSVTDVAAIGNTLRLVNGAELSESSMNMSTNCRSNVIYVGAGSSIKTKGDFAIRGRDNRVVVSNGTLYVSQSGSSLRFGKSTSDADETGNMLVFQGSSPKVARIDPDNNYPAQFYNGAVLRFEVPEEDGYSGVIFDSTAVELRGTARLEFAGLDVCQRKFRRSRDMQLTSAAFRVFDSSGTDITTTYLAQLTATLPDGCRVYRDGSNYLHLFVARKRLFCVSFR